MPTEQDRANFGVAIDNGDTQVMTQFLQRADSKELLLMSDFFERIPLHQACCCRQIKDATLELILTAAIKHGIITQMLETTNRSGWTCLHIACSRGLNADALRRLLAYVYKYANIKKMLEDPNWDGVACLMLACSSEPTALETLRVLFEYLVKFTDIKKVLEQKNRAGSTCLHMACGNRDSSSSFEVLLLLLEYFSKYTDMWEMLGQRCSGATCLDVACRRNVPIDNLKLLISFFPSNGMFQSVGAVAMRKVDDENIKQLINDPECWYKCRYWLFCNYKQTLNSLYPNSPEKTLEGLKELKTELKETAADEAIEKAIADLDRISSSSNDEGLKKENEALRKRNAEVEKALERIKADSLL